MVRRRGLLCEHKNRTKIPDVQFPRLEVSICDDCGDMYNVIVDGLEVWRTHR
jgi:hypothetical protein